MDGTQQAYLYYLWASWPDTVLADVPYVTRRQEIKTSWHYWPRTFQMNIRTERLLMFSRN